MALDITKGLEHFIGVDESNHGNIPEIVVAISSIHPDDILYHKEEIPKRRFKCKSDEQAEKRIKEILECRQYRFTALYGYHMDSLGPCSAKTSSFGQVLASFEYRKPKRVFIDGRGNSQDREDINYVISARSDIDHKIRFVKQGDQHFPILNLADQVAYIIFKRYEKITENEEGPFDEFKIPFEIRSVSRKSIKEMYRKQSHHRGNH